MRLVVFTYKPQLDLRGHETLCVNHATPNLVETVKAFQPDLIIEEEKNDGLANYSKVYKELSFPKAWWMIDAHITLAEHLNYAKQFDYVFCAQSWFKSFVSRETLAQVFYLPLCHTQTLTEYEMMLGVPLTRDIEFSFIGNIRSLHVERKEYVRRFLEKLGSSFFARQSDYDKTLQYLRKSKLTFNCSLNNDLNFRVWEAIACGTPILTDIVDDIFAVKNLYKFVTPYEKLSLDLDLINTPVSQYGGEEFIKAGHTLTHRLEQLVQMVNTEKQYEYA